MAYPCAQRRPAPWRNRRSREYPRTVRGPPSTKLCVPCSALFHLATHIGVHHGVYRIVYILRRDASIKKSDTTAKTTPFLANISYPPGSSDNDRDFRLRRIAFSMMRRPP